MRVLFVDDEQAVLDGLCRSLFHISEEWDVDTATSGSQALEIIRQRPPDVVVSDMRMPGMDGAELLTLTCEACPEAVRIVLSGQTDLEAALRVAPFAHQFLAKPCDVETIRGVIERACAFRDTLQDPVLRDTIGRVKALPSVPRLYTKLTQMLDDPDTSLSDVTELINSDPAMCAKTLQMVNSSFVGLGRVVHSVHEAVMRLGIRMVRNLALVSEVYDSTGSKAIPGAWLEAAAKHGLLVGTLASSLFKTQALKDAAFTAGLLHDVGKLIIWNEDAQVAQKLGYSRCQGDAALPADDMSLVGIDHAQVGACLLALWGLPNLVVEAVACHHSPCTPWTGLDLRLAVYAAEAVAKGRPIAPDCLARLAPTAADQQAWVEKAQAMVAGGSEG